MFTREVVEFSHKGLDALKAETKSTEQAIKDLHKANSRLKQEMRDGSWEKQARALSNTRRELQGVRQETERLQRAQRLQALRGQHGRVLGTAMHYGGLAGGRLQSVASGLGGGFSGMVGLAGSVGVPLGVGALAARGFSGTAAMAKLNNEIDRLSRHIATDLLPILEGFSRNMERINNARDNVRAGKGSFGERAVSAMFSAEGMLGGAGALMLNRATGGFAMNAGRAVGMGRFAMRTGARSPAMLAIAGGAYAMNEGWTEHAREKRLRELSTRETTQGKKGITFSSQYTQEEFGQVAGLVEKAGKITDPGQRGAALDQFIAHEKRQRDILGKNIDDKSILGGMFNSAEQRERHNRMSLRINAAERMKIDPTSAGSPNGMRIVQGAGEQRSAAGLYEELASAVPMLSDKNAKDDTTTGSVINTLDSLKSTLDSLLAPLQSLANAVSG